MSSWPQFAAQPKHLSCRFYQKQFQEGPAAALSQQHASPAWLREHDPAATTAQVLRVLKGDGSAVRTASCAQAADRSRQQPPEQGSRPLSR